MALLTELTTDQLNDLRSDNQYRVLQFICTVPNAVVVKFQPSAAPTTDVYATIGVGSISTGSMSNIRAGMLVIFSTTSDHQATETFRTRVRKVSGTSILYVGENSQSLTTSMYVTVIDTYEVQERLRHSETEVDWEIAFRKLLPIETALPTAVALTNDETEYSPTAVPKAMDASASSSFTHAWESSNSNDTLDSGGTTAAPTFTLEAEAHRWIRYTFTDSNGNSNYRVISVWTVPKDYGGVVALGFVGQNGDVATITPDTELGWSATLPAWDGIDTLLNKTFCAVVNDEWINGSRQSIRTNIAMCGYLQREVTQTQGDETVGQVSETRFTLEGFGQQLARQNVVPLTIFQTTAAPTAWDRIQHPTPARMLTYRLSEYSTILNLCSLSIPADDTDFVGDDLTLTSGKALEDIRTLAKIVNAEFQFDTNGHLDLCRDLVLLDDTTRNAAEIVATFQPSDLLTFEYEFDHSRTCSQVTVLGGSYDSAADRYFVGEAIAPAVARESEGDPLRFEDQVLETDLSEAEALAELNQRAANLFAANNPAYIARGTLKAEWGFLVPDLGSWVKFNIAGTDTARGKVFGSSDRWQLISVTTTTNSLTGTRQVDFVARHETSSTGAMTRANPIQNTSTVTQAYFPATTLPFSGVPTADGKWYNSRDTQPPGTPDPPSPECQPLGLRPKSGNAKFSAAVATNYVTVRVRGEGQIAATRWEDISDFENDGANGWIITTGSNQGGTLVAGVGWQSTGIGGAAQSLTIRKPFSVGTVATGDLQIIVYYSVSATWDVTRRMELAVGTGALIDSANLPNTSGTYVETVTLNATADTVRLRFVGNVGTPPPARITVTKIIVRGYGTNPFTGEEPPAIMGDALYHSYNEDAGGVAIPYEVNNGLYIEDDQPDFPPYNPSHEYFFPLVLVTGLATVKLEFKHADFDLAEFTNWSLQAIVCEREDP